MSPNIKEWI
jgi:hypothetical protein